MNVNKVLHTLGFLLIFLALFMILPLFFSLYYKDGDHFAILLSAGITATCGFLLWALTPGEKELSVRDSFAIVTLGWIAMACFGTLPYLLSGTLSSFTNALFESMSGFTTTGATILQNIEALPHGVLFWRSLTHWIGGMGIIVLSLAILPLLGVGGMQLFQAEVPGLVMDKISPRIQQTAKILWGVYLLLTVLETALLFFGGMSLFDALCHTFGTLATGGFSTKNASIGHFGSAYIHYVIIIFMLIAGANFALHYRALMGNFRSYLKDREFNFYIGMIVAAFLIVTLFNYHGHHYSSLPEVIRKSLFQVVSIQTTTGYVIADFEQWSILCQFLLLTLMFVGGCAGSTGGAMKVMRIMLLLRHGLRELKRLIHPRAVLPLRIGEKVIPDGAVTNILGFFFLYMLIFVLATLLMASLGLDLVSAIASVAATIGNIGPGLGSVGPTDNYAHIPLLGKWILLSCMLLGRLEIYTVLIIFSSSFWKK
ncbi:TrkH family potassium uptake protein [candidate division KSB1 bacterium]|nr:TrkH family potassium uptake protein [candidate division KSB1 bacterium]